MPAMTDTDPWAMDHAARRRNLRRAAPTYAAAAVLQREIGDRLLERMDYIRLQPQRVLDLGARLGHATGELRRRFPDALLVPFDIEELLARMPRSTAAAVAGGLPDLPFREGAFDVIYSCLELPWQPALSEVFAALRVALAPGGLLMFTTLGPHTLIELRESWRRCDGMEHVHGFYDMHDIGDTLVRAGFAEPVLDTERLSLSYVSVEALLRDLRHTGAQNALRGRRRTLTGRRRFSAMRAAYENWRTPQGRIPATVEVVYAQAWGPRAGVPRRTAAGEIAAIPPDQITRRRN